MQYQSFPGVKGGSRSSEKLAALRLPPFSGKRFLDVGCNEGFFCGYAAFDGAEKVLGIDRSAVAISRAKKRFPQCEFLAQSWDALPEGTFDVITLLSALHYAEDQAGLVHRLMESLSDDGVLVLEISIAPEPGDAWIKVKRSIDERFFPTRGKLGSILRDYAWKIIGHSVNQAGDPLQRYVVHVRKLKPYAYLLMGSPGSGKTTVSRHLFQQAKVPVVSGDRTYLQVSQGKHEVSEALRALIKEEFTTASIDTLTRKLFIDGFVKELAALWSQQAGYRDFALDSFVPQEHRESVKDALASLGYYSVEITSENPGRLIPAKKASTRAMDYEKHLKTHRTDIFEQQVVVTRMMDKQWAPSIRWHLDAPVSGQWLAEEPVVKVAGWVVGFNDCQQPMQVYTKTAKGRQLHELDRPRNDVLNAVFGGVETSPDFWRQHECGFSFMLDTTLLDENVELGIVLEEKEIPLARMKVEAGADRKASSFGERLIKRISGAS
nr:methyltransferase domain-containing protein [uncultured Halomonas sp.]